jgi:AraC-like DNA-binding protein
MKKPREGDIQRLALEASLAFGLPVRAIPPGECSENDLPVATPCLGNRSSPEHLAACMAFHYQMRSRGWRHSGPIRRRCLSGCETLVVGLRNGAASGPIFEVGPIQTVPAPPVAPDVPQMSQERLSAIATMLWALGKSLNCLPDAPDRPDDLPEPVARGLAYIEQHADEPLCIEAVAKASGLSLDGFSRLFRKSLKITFPEFVARQRIGRVLEDLLASPRSVAEVAFSCGFQSIPHFNRVFRRIVGCAPTDYRKLKTSTASARR